MSGFANAVTQCDKDSLHLLSPDIIHNIQSGLVQPQLIKGYLRLSQHICDPSFHTTFLESYPDMLPYIINILSSLPPTFSPPPPPTAAAAGATTLVVPALVWGWLKSNDVLVRECRDEVKQLLTCHSPVCVGICH